MEPAWAYLLTGLLCGVLSATFGVGSGLILVPILVLAFGFAQPTAQGTSLAVMVPMSLVGALSYRFLAGVPLEFSSTLYLSIGAVVGAIAGSRIPAWFSAPMAQRLFAVLLILIAVVVDRFGHKRWREAVLDRLARDDALLHVATRRQLELNLEQHIFDD